ncbi:MAG TPA: glycosyltransferase [Chitinophagaceae bacterium]|nr:glycosyltransferase [Chitinophagaceae bacterium]
MKHIFFTVTNDLTHDQRMHRICTSLAENGYAVTLAGRKLSSSLPLRKEKFHQKRIRCLFNKGKMFYTEYNIRLFFFLLFKKMDAICAIDLDTILPCLYVSKLKRIPRIYDAHELFTGLKEVATRPRIQNFWAKVERKAVPQFRFGYTVSESIAEEFSRRYGVKYAVIRNMTKLKEFTPSIPSEKFLLYQGAVNEARAFEWLIPAMKQIKYKLVICGDGNFMSQLKQLIKENAVESKVELKGMLSPDELWTISQKATIGMGVAENTGINQYLALPNKFFDYIHAGLPQIAMNFPEYVKINRRFEVAVLIDDINSETIAGVVNNLMDNTVLYQRMRENCLKARQILNWQQEEKELVDFYQFVFKQ